MKTPLAKKILQKLRVGKNPEHTTYEVLEQDPPPPPPQAEEVVAHHPPEHHCGAFMFAFYQVPVAALAPF